MTSQRITLTVPIAVLTLWATSHGIVATAQQEQLQLPGVEAPVEIVTDRWGINHIYAETEEDLFFAQGYAAARDRLFQFEIWRRQASITSTPRQRRTCSSRRATRLLGTGCSSLRSGGARQPGPLRRSLVGGSLSGTSVRGYIGSAATWRPN